MRAFLALALIMGLITAHGVSIALQRAALAFPSSATAQE